MCKAKIINGRPIVQAIVFFPTHQAAGVLPPMLDFLVDTGADYTLINAIDAEKLGIKYHTSAQDQNIATYDGIPLAAGPTMGGMGGGIRTYEIRNVSLFFVTWGRNRIVESHEEPLPCLYVPEGTVRQIPNLLGRDVLERFNLTMSATDKMVELARAAVRGTYTVNYL
jgi:hypothetical protein